MPTVTFDGRSFMLDGRRIWIVSGSIHYARVPRDLWAQRIHSAKAAGLNTIETPVFWNRHETRPGQFDFKGDNDLRHFIQLVGQAGLWCILRPGPFIGSDWDFGGLPSWLTGIKGVKFRVSNGPFLEACSRYLTAVVDQVRDLQVTNDGKAGPGPLLLVQNESAWTCGDDQQGAAYLGELDRYLRESGIEVPTINGNNLWQGVEGEIDCWTGTGDMLGTVRQLAAVRPEQPRLVVEYTVGHSATWGSTPGAPFSAPQLEQRLAQILAGGGQFNISPFHGGTNFGFWGGRLPESSDGFVTASHDCAAPLTEVGVPGPLYPGVRRICTFASRFARVLANLDPTYRPVVVYPDAGGPQEPRGRAKASDAVSAPSVAHATGTQGGLTFVFNPQAHTGARTLVKLLTADGTQLSVDATGQAVTWCLFDALIGGRARLDYSSLSAFGTVGSVLVLFGPHGAEGQLSVNGSPLIARVPERGKAPAIIEHEGATLVIAGPDQLETIHLTDDAVFIGASELTPAGEPVGVGHRNCTRIGSDGKVTHPALAAPAGARKGADRPVLSEWTAAGCADYCDGSSARFAAIDGPADLVTLGSPFGYGWYRIRIKSSAPRKVRLAMPFASDRLRVFSAGEEAGQLGSGPGASPTLSLSLNKGPHTLVVLAENMGRLSGGVTLGEPKGIFGHLYHTRPIRVPRAVLKTAEPFPILTFRTPIWEVDSGDLTLPDRPTWTLAHRRRTPVILTIGPSPARALLFINNKPVDFIDRGGVERHVLMPEQMKAGVNIVQLAILPDPQAASADDVLHAIAPTISFEECEEELTEKADWAFAKWETPRASAYRKPKPGSSGPMWWTATFPAADPGRPLFLDAAGLTKGQVYVNGRHLGRYFVATANGRAVPPQSHYFIPGPWLSAEGENQLTIFDEHGAAPSRVRLVHEAPPSGH